MSEEREGGPPLHLFEGYGIELEYMVVDRRSLDVLPITDQLMKDVTGGYPSEIERGPLCWSNELALHVVELKTNGPAPALEGVAAHFQQGIADIEEVLARRGATLVGTAMHPWMDPDAELELWPHEYNAVYERYDQIFDCHGHGWANLQSMHVNLPFGDDEEFGRLHAAIRVVLPVLPALAASSPFADGRATGLMDTRMEVYRTNSGKAPVCVGVVVPEPIFTEAAYRREILERIYETLEPGDPDGVLRDEFANSRGAIARFQRDAIEIRVIDVQECPRHDLAVAALASAVVRALVAEELSTGAEQRRWDEHRLAAILRGCIRDGERTRIEDREYLGLLGMRTRTAVTAGELWRELVARCLADHPGWKEWQEPLEIYLEEGCLARRMVHAAGSRPTREDLHRVLGELRACLLEGRSFLP